MRAVLQRTSPCRVETDKLVGIAYLDPICKNRFGSALHCQCHNGCRIIFVGKPFAKLNGYLGVKMYGETVSSKKLALSSGMEFPCKLHLVDDICVDSCRRIGVFRLQFSSPLFLLYVF